MFHAWRESLHRRRSGIAATLVVFFFFKWAVEFAFVVSCMAFTSEVKMDFSKYTSSLSFVSFFPTSFHCYIFNIVIFICNAFYASLACGITFFPHLVSLFLLPTSIDRILFPTSFKQVDHKKLLLFSFLLETCCELIIIFWGKKWWPMHRVPVQGEVWRYRI